MLRLLIWVGNKIDYVVEESLNLSAFWQWVLFIGFSTAVAVIAIVGVAATAIYMQVPLDYPN